ncbi:CRISPR-associated helicase/endonuclease Cas3 [Listeria fleischmannii]|uniref:CRISPR-associated helicase Cas3 n=1 Tax=Listeria fleischmannii FSL S10-1203 TaxID=1265822 RepID=W7DT86_9LIST|nr:CRISPR-associated helicase/endonuclease Cas3 [Listeria fleischmannii]EUJ57889.1 CRISPR-associated helicase Cas3 [Listeria fleischmannii FSL S10-1203]
MKKFYAKSNPKETIQEHTDKLIENFILLKHLYSNIRVDWELLYEICVLHDLGKMGNKFQEKLKSKQKMVKGEIPHGWLSIAFIDYKRLKKEGYSVEEIGVIFQAIAYHHDRNYSFEIEELEAEFLELEEPASQFYYDKWKLPIPPAKKLNLRYFSIGEHTFENDYENFKKYVLLKGLLNRIDYAASASIPVEWENQFLERDLAVWKKNKGISEWNALQQFMNAHQNENVVVIAQTGMGKTEAGLLWLGDAKGFFTLPLKTAINSIYERVKDDILTEKVDTQVGLLHSDIFSRYLLDEKEYDIAEYITRTKQLSLPLTICTLDQIFDIVYRYPGFEHKLATLSYSKVILDEVQMYSPDLLAYVIVGLKYIQTFGGKFAILTATLPGIVTHYMKEEKLEFTMPEKPFITDIFRHSVCVKHRELDIQDILEHANRKRVLVICNTVNKAKEIFSALQTAGVNTKLFHSQFIRADRRQKEQEIFQDGQVGSEFEGVWVATQVVEASLDIDFDLLFTELSDINGLFQRMGRCYRKRENPAENNIFVYDGGEKKCNGVGFVVDKEIFQFSKEAIAVLGGKLLESKKMELIDEVYSYERLEGTEYNKLLQNNIDHLKDMGAYEIDKNEAKKRFRNILSVSVIPKSIFEENHRLITLYKNETNKFEKQKLWEKLKDLQVDVSAHLFEKSESKIEPLSKYKKLQILDCFYDNKTGVTRKERGKENKFF